MDRLALEFFENFFRYEFFIDYDFIHIFIEPFIGHDEEAFVAALSSCHMLFFLSIAAKRRWLVDAYIDEAGGIMATDEAGKMAMTRVILRPRITFSGKPQPTTAQLEKMHHQAHNLCFIANSVKTQVDIEIQESPHRGSAQ